MNAHYEPHTWEEAAGNESRLVLAEYRARLQRSPLGTVDEALDKRFDELRTAVENDDSTWARIEFRHLASVALVGYVAASNARVKDAMDKVVTTIAAKQHDYGYDNIAGFGSQGLVVRISDKRARLKNLKKRGAPANEPLLDTWLDIVGYCIVGLMWEAGTFSLPLAGDVAVRAWNEAVQHEPISNEPDPLAEQMGEHIIRQIAREEIEKWHSQQSGNTPPTPWSPPMGSGGTQTVPDIKGRDIPTPHLP